MNILWVTNVAMPEYFEIKEEKTTPFGGWLLNTSDTLQQSKDIKLSFSFPVAHDVTSNEVVKGNNTKYYPFKSIKLNGKMDDANKKRIKFILNDVKPDLVHIHGSEFRHTYEFVNICKEMNIKSIISIQGLVSKYSQHVRANLPGRIYYGKTIRNILLNDSVYDVATSYANRGKYEIKAIKLCNRVIGRTSWDKASTKSIDNNINYFHNNENLRHSFYREKWSLDNVVRNSIFLSQGNYSIKGLHYVLEAASILKKKYNNFTINIAGSNITDQSTLKARMGVSKYSKYISSLIKKYDLEDTIQFVGLLDEKEMVVQYLSSHIFICPSSIENSPNSLGEAMILGVPTVASYVGGIPDMLEHNLEGFLYQHNAPYMLAHYIDEILSNDILAKNLSVNSRKRAKNTHDVSQNIEILKRIYGDIIAE